MSTQESRGSQDQHGPGTFPSGGMDEVTLPAVGRTEYIDKSSAVAPSHNHLTYTQVYT